jgi:hypothetical protein
MRRRSKAERLMLEDLDWLTSDPRGMRFVARLMQWSGYFDPPYSCNTELQNFNAGRRATVHPLFNTLVANWADRLIRCLDEFSQASDARSDPDHDAGPESFPGSSSGTESGS